MTGAAKLVHCRNWCVSVCALGTAYLLHGLNYMLLSILSAHLILSNKFNHCASLPDPKGYNMFLNVRQGELWHILMSWGWEWVGVPPAEKFWVTPLAKCQHPNIHSSHSHWWLITKICFFFFLSFLILIYLFLFNRWMGEMSVGWTFAA